MEVSKGFLEEVVSGLDPKDAWDLEALRSVSKGCTCTREDGKSTGLQSDGVGLEPGLDTDVAECSCPRCRPSSDFLIRDAETLPPSQGPGG